MSKASMKGYLCFSRQEDYKAVWVPEGEGGALLCSVCKRVLDGNYFNPNIVVAPMKADFLFHMYGGGYFVSEKVRELVEENAYQGVIFKKPAAAEGIYHMHCSREVAVIRDDLQLSGPCGGCGEDIEITFGRAIKTMENTRYYQILSQPVQDGFYFTDINFFRGPSKHKLLVIGIKTREKIKKAGIKGLIMEPVI